MNRNHSIDAFRGFAIIGMVFFTVILRLSINLPDVLRHNVWGTVHLGDFILPMFLFASGLSLVYFLNKMEKEEKPIVLRKIFFRFAKLVIIAILLSNFSAYGFLEMDEVMLCAILFISCVVLSKLNWKILIGIIFFINLSYIFLIYFDMTSIFIGHYLGGYPAALYYLPVMLTGLVIGQGIISEGLWRGSNQTVFWSTFIFFLVFLIFIPLNKMVAAPSFILLSILFSFLVFMAVHIIVSSGIKLKRLEYIGKKPIRYWLMMYIVFLIPLWFYAEFFKQAFPLRLQWYIATILSFGLMVLLYFISRAIDYITISD
jgi:predicted acyltransferase